MSDIPPNRRFQNDLGCDDGGPISSAAQLITASVINRLMNANGQNSNTSASVTNNTSRNNSTSAAANTTGSSSSTIFNGQLALEQIQQSTSNIEHLENNRSIKESLAEAIRVQGRKEKTLRQSTISYKIHGIDAKDISNWIDEEWVHKMKQAPVTYWSDKEFTHCQFISNQAKLAYLSSGLNDKPLHMDRMVPMNDLGENFRRRTVRMIINNVRPAVNTDRLIEIIKNCTDFDTEITEVKDGMPHPVTKNRSIFFRVNSHGLLMLIDKLDGEIPYTDKNSYVRTRFKVKINCKPWQCKDCGALGSSSIGPHHCEGKKCRNCSNKGHETKDCPTGLKYCSNCKKKGHKTTDLHCQSYLNEIAKEIRKMDIPMIMFEDKAMRLNLAKSVQLK